MAMRYRYYFAEALVLTILVFIGGFLVGLGIENNRNARLADSYISTESEIIDLGAQLDISNLGRYTCSELVNRNSDIGDQIYRQALIFEQYETSAIFTKSQLVKEHRKFDALRTLFWINSIKIKERCGNNVLDTVIYLYNYPTEDISEIAKQKVMARITQEIKSNSEKNIILIPIAKNLNISSLNTLTSNYPNMNESVLLIVNEKETFLPEQTEQIRNYFGLIFE